ncbi:hypothetical protein RQP53_15245 [Paucibacter sp. APW11]|uniref:Uncharacterized protein n=1 Tax=Roseateles aquae TaxID=3077235 RepID=A0ABU3PDK0_9BURK|nr:hypothetical protein [Paucibacter sp. APW11]MDT9000629.1 hypothetical protein [Paucibacter sp. APW11]
MREPARIDDVLAAIRLAWVESPDLRLGQLLVNAIRPKEPCPEVFYVEDDQLLAALQAMAARVQVVKAGVAPGEGE